MIIVKLERLQQTEFELDKVTLQEMLADFGVDSVDDLTDDQIEEVAWEIVEDGDWYEDFDHCEVIRR